MVEESTELEPEKSADEKGWIDGALECSIAPVSFDEPSFMCVDPADESMSTPTEDEEGAFLAPCSDTTA